MGVVLGLVLTLGAGLLFLILIIGGLIGVAFWASNKLSYTRKVIIWTEVGDHYEPNGKDVAKEIRIGDGGEMCLFLKKRKVWRVANKQTGRNTYHFFIGRDGYWYNDTVQFDDGQLRTKGINPELHKVMRYQNSALRKNLHENLKNKITWWDKNGGWLKGLIFVMVTGIFFMMIGKYFFAELPRTLDLLNQILERMNTIMTRLEVVEGTAASSGLVPAVVGIFGRIKR